MTVDQRPPFTTRLATLQDAASIAKLGASTFSTTFGHSVTPQQLADFLAESYTEEAVSKEILDPQKDTIIAVDQEGSIAGFLLLTRGSSEPCISHLDKTIELQRIYVDVNFQGKGVGKLLANVAEKIATDEGFRYMWLGVWEENHKGHKVYESFGYKPVGKHVFDVGGDLQTDLVMLKELK